MDGNGFPKQVKLIASAYLCALVFALSGCSKPETIYTHGTPAAERTRVAIEFPGIDELRVPLAADGFHKIDFMALGGCELQITLGKYQSSLGRWPSDSQRLLLDLEYLRLAPQCIGHKQKLGQTELATSLEETRKLKRDQLAAAIFNATLANIEFQQLWGRSITLKEQPGQQRLTLLAIQAINELAGLWLSGDHQANNIGFEIHLSEIAKGGIVLPGGYDWELHHHILQLEQKLATVLPPQFLAWQKDRDHYFSGLETPTKLD